MLETPKALNTHHDRLNYGSDNFKDITMDNQQETNGLIIILVGASETLRQKYLRLINKPIY